MESSNFENLGFWGKRFCILLVLTKDRNNLRVKWVYPCMRIQNSASSIVQTFAGNSDLKTWKVKTRQQTKRLFWNTGIEKFYFSLSIFWRLSIWRWFFGDYFFENNFLALVSVNVYLLLWIFLALAAFENGFMEAMIMINCFYSLNLNLLQ